MTAFALTSEQQDFAERVRELASGQLRALAEAGTPGQVNRELIKAMGNLGLLARLFPGVGAGGLSREAAAMDLCLLREALATQSTEAETALALQGLGSYPVLQSGQEEVVRRWLPAVAAGDAVAAFALTEPGAGSDAAALALRAEPDGQGWRIDPNIQLDAIEQEAMDAGVLPPQGEHLTDAGLTDPSPSPESALGSESGMPPGYDAPATG